MGVAILQKMKLPKQRFTGKDGKLNSDDSKSDNNAEEIDTQTVVVKEAKGIPPRLWSHILPPPTLIPSTIYRHYTKGPPDASWSLSFDIAVAVMTDFLKRSSKKTVEDLQILTSGKGIAIPNEVKRTKIRIPQTYRIHAGQRLGCLLTAEEERIIGWDWRKDYKRVAEMKGEWLSPKEGGKPKRTIYYLHGGGYYLGSFSMYRPLLAKLAKLSSAQTFAINYRLAPQHPFPAAVEDALAGYLYLIDPPEGIDPIDPSSIVISGDSAGGGLTFALLLAIRDAKLPSPAGAMTLSPWIDLTHSFPSIIQNLFTDYLPHTGFKHIYSEAMDYSILPRFDEAHATEEQQQQQSDEAAEAAAVVAAAATAAAAAMAIPEDDLTDRFHFYAENKALMHPWVSPVFDKGRLRGLPPLLIQVGTSERLRDESVFAALQASNCFEDGSGTVPTHVQLEMYVGQPHVFHFIFPNRSQVSSAVQRLVEFCCRVTDQKKPKNDNASAADRLTVTTVPPHGGKPMDTKEELLGEFANSEKWLEWQKLLSRISLKERLDQIQAVLAEKHAKKTKLANRFIAK
ncbi:Alpha/Beta hydrolase protein [Dichotomocladium elegans]|nr:Alpha/Beta hydrolase protein [Dichotomocladium elegans]